MILLRWVAILWSVIVLVCLCVMERGIGSMVLAGIFLTLFFFICWTFGEFARSDPNSRKAPHHD